MVFPSTPYVVLIRSQLRVSNIPQQGPILHISRTCSLSSYSLCILGGNNTYMEETAQKVDSDAFAWCFPQIPPYFEPIYPLNPFIFFPYFQPPQLKSPEEQIAVETTGLKKSARGRRTRPDTILLNRFRNINKAGRSPKKEYLRIHLIRGLKRAIRQILEKQRSFSPLNRVDKGDEEAVQHWSLFKAAVKQNKATLKAVSAPTLDTLSKRPRSTKYAEPEDTYNCYNNAFCKSFLSNSVIRKVFELYLNVVFADMDEKVLSQRFGFEARAESEEERGEDWQKLREFLYGDMLTELKIEPFNKEK